MILDERTFKTFGEARAAAQAEANKSQRPWHIMGTMPRYRISQDEPPTTAAFGYMTLDPEPPGLVRGHAI